MKLLYRLLEHGAEVVRCFGNDSRIVIPNEITGIPVIKAAPYTFSDRKSEDTFQYLEYNTEESSVFGSDIRLLAGEMVEEVIFPETVQEIGNYIFYGCKNLKKLEFSNHLNQIGSGAFTGCGRLSTLTVHMKSGSQSCAKDILGDLWQRIDVTFCYKGDRRAKLVFPEHYEEAVENTPARILFTQHHGSGNNYRQCFYNKEMDYAKYDSLFSVAAAWDKPEVLADLAFSRLIYPWELSKNSKKAYENLFQERYEQILEYLVTKEKLTMIKQITESQLWNPDMLEYALEIGARKRTPEILGYLMNEKQKQIPAGRKSFVL